MKRRKSKVLLSPFKKSRNKGKEGSELSWLQAAMHKPKSSNTKNRLFKGINHRNSSSFISKQGAITINRATNSNSTRIHTFRLPTCNQSSSSNMYLEFSNSLSDSSSYSSKPVALNRLLKVDSQARQSTSSSTWSRAISKRQHTRSKQTFPRQTNLRQHPHL